MNREVPYSENEKCDNCGKLGAFDFMGDLICEDCLSPKKKKKNSLPVEARVMQTEPEAGEKYFNLLIGSTNENELHIVYSEQTWGKDHLRDAYSIIVGNLYKTKEDAKQAYKKIKTLLKKYEPRV